MLNQFVSKTSFQSTADFIENFKINVPPDFNFGYDVVDAWAKKEPNKIALLWANQYEEEKQFSFAHLKQMSDSAAASFLEMGIEKGDMVMLVLKRHYEFWISIIALHKIGAVAIPATHMLTTKDIVYRNNAAEVKAIVTTGDNDILENIEASLPQSPTLKIKITTGDQKREGWYNFHTQLANAAPFERPENVNCNADISLLYFTSGTSGEPKMVTHDFTYPLAHIVTARFWHNLNENSIHFTLADTGWGKAVWGKLYGQWITGATVVAYDHDRFQPAKILELIERYRITSFCAPPTVYRFLIREDFSRYNLSSLQYCTTAGEAMNPSVFEKFYQLTGLKIYEAYGQTETAPLIITFPWLEPKPGSMGVANPMYNLDLLTANRLSAMNREAGEIVVRTENYKKPLGLFAGYYRNSELEAEVYENNIYHTLDEAWRDSDGFYWFVGRMDDVIKSSGYRIGPFEVESALMTHPAVLECAVTGEPDEIRGQVIKAAVVLTKEYANKAGEDLANQLQEHVKKVTAPYKYPRIVEFVKELPKTISGKIKRFELRRRN